MSAPLPNAGTTPPAFLRIPEFDGLRGLLAWWVVFGHVLLACGFRADDFPHGIRLVQRGGYAVDLFVILSGFVIFKLLHDSRERYGPFMVRRIFRLYPVYLVCLGLGYLVHGFVRDVLFASQEWTPPTVQALVNFNAEAAAPWQHLFAHLTMLHGLIPEQVLPGATIAYLGAAWSLSLEFQFYLVAPILFAGMWRTSELRWIAVTLVFLVGGYVVSAYLQSPTFPMPSTLPNRIAYFWIGMLSFFAWQHWCDLGQPRVASTIMIALVPLTLIFSLLLPIGVWCGVMAVVFSSQREQPLRLIGKVLNSRALQYLGTISFSTYLVHASCIVLSQWVIMRIAPELSRRQVLIYLFPATIATTLAASAVLYQIVELPGIRAGRNVTRRWRKSPFPAR